MSSRERAEKAALNNLEALGSDIEQSHPMDFFLYFPEESQAYSAAAQLYNLQFNVSVSFSEAEEEWLCLATKKINPTCDRVGQLSSFFEKLARANNGAYDGWETPVMNGHHPENSE